MRKSVVVTGWRIEDQKRLIELELFSAMSSPASKPRVAGRVESGARI